MSFIQLSNKEKHIFGKRFTPDIDVIAYALSHINRYTGHVGQYSVAQHSVLVANQLPDELKLSGLLHDASEAYLNDLSSPLKSLLPCYSEMEEFYHDTIDNYFNVNTRHHLIKDADIRMLVTEAKHFELDLIVDAFPGVKPYDVVIKNKLPHENYVDFMDMFNRLTSGYKEIVKVTRNIATCEVETPWTPKVGEDCLVSYIEMDSRKGKLFTPYKKCVVRGIDEQGAWVAVDNKHVAMNVQHFKFKPLPPELAYEEKLIQDIALIIHQNQGEGVTNPDTMAADIFASGYRKVEPISYADFRENISEHDEDWLYLCNNNHVIYKKD